MQHFLSFVLKCDVTSPVSHKLAKDRQMTAISNFSTALQAVRGTVLGKSVEDAGRQAGERYSYSSVLKFVSPACPSQDVLTLTGLIHGSHNFKFYFIFVNLNRAGCMRSTRVKQSKTSSRTTSPLDESITTFRNVGNLTATTQRHIPEDLDPHLMARRKPVKVKTILPS
jgi:hypothetical protein